MKEGACSIGIFGLGVMGAALAENLMRHGIKTAVYSIDPEERMRFLKAHGQDSGVSVCDTQDAFIRALQEPRKVFLMVTAGEAVDSVMDRVIPELSEGDVILDGGNSYYKDTMRRNEYCRRKGVHFVGVGVSGGEEGARKGPAFMAGGSREGYRLCEDILCSIAADAGGDACCAWLGENGAGHYVKMIHNGIEYAVMQLLAETYQFLRDGIGLSGPEIGQVFETLRKGELASFLTDGSAAVLRKKDADGTALVDKILDVADQKGTGMWTLQESLQEGVYIPTVYEAVEARVVSSGAGRRRPVGADREKSMAGAPVIRMDQTDAGQLGQRLEKALYLGILCCFDQGFSLLASAAARYGWSISYKDVIRTWRAGCILRCDMLERIPELFGKDRDSLVDALPAAEKKERFASLKECIADCIRTDSLCAAWMSVYNYILYKDTECMPVQLVQALRDYFGSHTYKRMDKEGIFHTDWTEGTI